jgi:uncharacterized membrane protein
MEKTSVKNIAWLVVGFVLTFIPVIVFWYLESVPVDCDQFSCIGYLLLFGPIFLFGVALLLIVLIVNIVMLIDKQLKKKRNTEYD